MQTHETVSSFRRIVLSSDRKFGLVFGSVLSIFALWPVLRGAPAPNLWLAGAGVAMLALALFRPHWLAPFNRAWFKLGLVLNRIVNPVVMGILFFGAVVPLGWYLRRKGADLLDLGLKPDAGTYWTPREPPGPEPGTFTKQF